MDKVSRPYPLKPGPVLFLSISFSPLKARTVYDLYPICWSLLDFSGVEIPLNWLMMHNDFLALVLLVFLLQATSHALQKRDAPLVTVNIPLTVNKDQRYVAGVNMVCSPNMQRIS